MSKYDDASWHYGGIFPKDLHPSAGATHIGMFLTWCILAGLGNKDFLQEIKDDYQKLIARQITPGGFLLDANDEKFVDAQLSVEGNGFTTAYYESRDGSSLYLVDYMEINKDIEEIYAVPDTWVYAVPDTWERFDQLAPRIQERYDSWVAANRPTFLN